MKKHLKLPPPPGKSRRGNAVGTTISDRYELLRLLGEGTSGRVYEAVQTSVDRTVAVKVLKADAVGEFRERFTREARAIARLTHPNCITLHDFGYSDELDSLYMVTEFVRGKELFALLRRKERMPVTTVIKYMLQVGQALHHAHKNGILHRDLKPENILVTNRGDVKVLDFGLARIFEGVQETQGRRLTTQGAIYGTPVYMCPEQCGGDLDIDERADLYALGIMMYEAFGGDPPFDSDDYMEILEAHLRKPVPPIDAEIPADLRDLIMQLLEKDRDARPGSAREVVERLQGLLVELVIEDAELDPDVSQEIARSLLTAQGLGSAMSSEVSATRTGEESEAHGDADGRMATVELVGAEIGPYQIERLITVGSMGAVFLATGREGGRVALKVLSTRVDEGLRVGERFDREERALRAIDDPRVVRVLGAGHDERFDRTFLAMEYIDGTSLRDMIGERGPLPLPDVLEMAHEVALGLAAAHEAGTVHRNLKPSNVMLVRDELSHPKLLDFGLAFFGDDKRLTLTGEAVGSVPYMSPEALLGSVPDQRADIYALGLIIYEALAGERKYRGKPKAVAAEILATRVDGVRWDLDAPTQVVDLLDKLCGEIEARPENAREAAALISATRTAVTSDSPEDTSARSRQKTR